jgi:heat shock protein HspQ
MIEAVAYLQRENIFTGAHVLNAKDIITILEKEIYGTVAFNDRTSKTEPFFRFITEKSKEKADIFEKEIAKLSSTVSGSSLNKRAVNSILNEKSKICYSWLPNKFIGIGMQQSKEYYNTINNCYRCYQSNSHEFLIK